jgi:Rod binding domain-containing protein
MGTSLTLGSQATQTTLLEASQDRMLQQLKSSKSQIDDQRIDKGAKEFEAMLLSSWLQQAEQSMATVPGAEDDEDAAGREQMMSLGVQSLATSMAASGGIGIASMIAKAMHANAAKAEAKPMLHESLSESPKINEEH